MGRDGKTSVLVTGVGGRSVGHQILHSLSLVAEKYEVTAVDCDAFSFGMYTAPHSEIVPPAVDEDYTDAILDLVSRRKISVILPGTEAELRVLTDNRKKLEDAKAMVLASESGVVSLFLDKNRLSVWLSKNGFCTPKTIKASAWKNNFGFPVLAKPSKASGGSRNIALILNSDEMDTWIENHPSADDYIVQDYVGDAESEYTVGVMIGRDGELIDSIVLHRKLLGFSVAQERESYTVSSGYTQGFIVEHPQVAEVCEDLALKSGAKGPVNIQCRIHRNEVYIFEVHPRFSGSSSIRAEVGFNEPDVLIENFLFGKKFNRLEYRRDVAAIRAFQQIIIPISELKKLEGKR